MMVCQIVRRFSMTFFPAGAVGSDATVVRTVCRVCEKGSSARAKARKKARRTLTTQIGFDRTEVAAPANAETRIDSSVESVARVPLRDLRTTARASSKLVRTR